MARTSTQPLLDVRAVVTGAGSGIGAATAETFARGGARVLLVDVDEASLGDVASTLGETATACVADLRAADGVDLVLDRAHTVLGHVDVLINDAGVSSKTPLLEVTEDEWEAVMAVNGYAAAHLAAAFADEMRARGRGCIVNVSSISGLGGGAPQSVYGISKGALLGLTRELADAVAGSGVRVNAVLPGVIDTPMVRRDVAADGDPDAVELAAWIRAEVPLGRIGEPQEVADVIAFLASPAGRGITGAFVPVDGGFLSA
jgi:NAD(P)-dependent dehydrogenase (short-subunit alcohol dehydrogenase family)